MFTYVLLFAVIVFMKIYFAYDELDVMQIEDSRIYNNGCIILRGDTFRDSYNSQIIAYKSIIRHVINPLQIRNINIIIVTYSRNYESDIKNIFADYHVEFHIIERKSQAKNFVNCLNFVNQLYDFVLILRNDLIFKQDLDYTRLSKNKILFQWNLFHNKQTKEMADQIICIGGNMFPKFKQLTKRYKIDYRWTGTLHNLYNFCITHFKKHEISFLNELVDPDPTENRCKIRGNPGIDLGNPLYTYTRYYKGHD